MSELFGALYDTKTAAGKLGVSAATMVQWRHSGAGPKFVKLGNRTIRYRQIDLDEFAASCLTTPKAKKKVAPVPAPPAPKANPAPAAQKIPPKV